MAIRPVDEVRYQRDITRTYRTERIEVHWEPARCIHVGTCFMSAPEVFDPRARPWVRPGAADPDRVADVVMRCPSGALHYRRLDDGPQEEDLIGPVEVRATRDGPYHVRGPVDVVEASGEVRHDTRVVLCRCGASRNKPYCDGTHTLIGFRDPPD
jgi:uncharacterized Fe-S cluster protein YjdI